LRRVTEPGPEELRDLQTFVVQLGSAMNAAGESAYSVQDRLARVAAAYGASSARITAFPTFLMVTMGRGEPAALETTAALGNVPRLDRIAALDDLVEAAERGEVSPVDGLQRLDEIRTMRRRFGRIQSIVGYSVFTLGICLILKPAPREVAAAAVLGAIVGLLRAIGRNPSPLQILMPVLAAFVVSALAALAVKEDVTGPGLRAMVAALVVFLPGATLTTAVLELAAGQVVAGASRLVSGAMQLAFLAFGIVAGIEAVNVPSALVFEGSNELLGAWAPWLGVLIFAIGVVIANSAPARSFPGLVVVLYAAWTGQVIGNAIFGGYVSAFVGALVMTPVAWWVSRLPSAMSAHASFLPGFWLLVPGALGLIGLAQFAGDANAAGTQDLINTVFSIFAVAIGVLCGTLVLSWAAASGRIVDSVSGALLERSWWHNRFRSVSVEEPRSESDET
jgi:uncharacterized membrane protein YjjP (DUF1212 family)